MDKMQSSALLETVPSVMLIFPHSENCNIDNDTHQPRQNATTVVSILNSWHISEEMSKNSSL